MLSCLSVFHHIQRSRNHLANQSQISWPPCPYMVKTFKNLLRTRSLISGNLACSIRDSRFTVYKNDDPVLTMAYFMARSALVTFGLYNVSVYRTNDFKLKR